jgi:hypothetical protein
MVGKELTGMDRIHRIKTFWISDFGFEIRNLKFAF